MQGRIIKLISNDYTVLSDKEYICKSRGLFRNKNIKPLVGDLVEFDEKNNYILNVLERKTYRERDKPPVSVWEPPEKARAFRGCIKTKR